MNGARADVADFENPLRQELILDIRNSIRQVTGVALIGVGENDV